MVFPLYDENPLGRARLPVVTWTLIAINIVVFLAMIASDDARRVALIRAFGLVPAALTHSWSGGNFWPEATLVTSMFVHASWGHIIGNMIYLWVFGDDIEDALGPLRFIGFYLLAGIAATLAFVAANPSSTIPLVGASGAIAGVLAAYMMLRPCAKVSVLVVRIVVRLPAYLVIGGWLLLQLFDFLGSTEDDVAYLAHLGGLVAGAALFWVLRPAGVKLFLCRTPAPGNDGPPPKISVP